MTNNTKYGTDPENVLDHVVTPYNNDHNILKWFSVELQSLFSYCHCFVRPKLLASCVHRATTSSCKRLNAIAIRMSPNTRYAQHAII